MDTTNHTSNNNSNMTDTSAEGQDSVYTTFAHDHRNDRKRSHYIAYTNITNDRLNERKRSHYTETNWWTQLKQYKEDGGN